MNYVYNVKNVIINVVHFVKYQIFQMIKINKV